jgi:hypothetical protein
MAAINREWHEANRIPANPTRAQRGAWHAAHQDVCGCRTPSAAEQALIDEHRRGAPSAPITKS